MKKIITIYILLTCGIGYGQNLVPNGDFEQFSGCPTNWGQIDSALFWMNPTIVGAGGGSPDYFNSCATSFLVSVPSNPIGFQIPHSGNAYGGILLYHLFVGSNIREFIEVPLVSPLIANQQYHFEMYANISDDGAASTDAIAVYFSDTVISGVNNALPLPFNPQINNISGNFLDSLNWTLVSGDYTALGGESYLIIGNFKDDSLTTTIPNNTPENGSAPVAYALIDDVSLTLITGTNSSNEINIFETFPTLFPNPVTDKLNVQINNNEQTEIILYDLSSKKLLQQTFTNTITINTEQLAKGMYLYTLRNRNGIIKNGQVIKQ